MALQLGFGDRREDFWRPMGYDFWFNLEWTEEGRQVLTTVEKFFSREQICLLTSPCDTDGCAQGKLHWIKKHIPEYSLELHVT